MFILKGHKHPVQRVEFSADGRTLLSVDARRGVRLWDLETRVVRLKLENDYLVSATFTPGSQQILTFGQEFGIVDQTSRILLHDVHCCQASRRWQHAAHGPYQQPCAGP